MSSLRRILASRSNGARSTGPKTPEGKRRSSRNALRHGLLAKCIVLSDESPEAFHTLVAEHLARFAPAGGVELGMVEEMAAALWRLRRAWAIETRLLDGASASQPPADPLSRIAAAFSELASSPQFALLNRYESRLHCMYQRALRNLLLLRALVPDAPETGDGGRASAPRRTAESNLYGVPNEPRSIPCRVPNQPGSQVGHSPAPLLLNSDAPHPDAPPCGISNT
jgi:hypothetical protein